jgi:hypothetical protein
LPPVLELVEQLLLEHCTALEHALPLAIFETQLALLQYCDELQGVDSGVEQAPEPLHPVLVVPVRSEEHAAVPHVVADVG